MNDNRVFVNQHDLVEIVVNGNQTVETVQTMADEAQRLGFMQQAQGKRVLVLDNLLLIGAVPPEARRKVVEAAKTMTYEKLAMVGKGTLLRLGTNLMLHATGKGSKVRYFEDYDQAVAWLLAQ